jgi:glutamate synthase (NADPH/NADH) large chain
VEQHARFTGSARAKRELGQWEKAQKHFVVVVPREYRQVLERQSDATSNTDTASARHGLAIADSMRSARHG